MGFPPFKMLYSLRSFEPILRLLPQSIAPVSQHWATWALYNLVSVYREYLKIQPTCQNITFHFAVLVLFLTYTHRQWPADLNTFCDIRNNVRIGPIFAFVPCAASKYCPLLIKEGGICLLERVLELESSQPETKDMAQ